MPAARSFCGLDGDRIKVLQNGGSTIDASTLSNDHAVALDPLVAERIEVVRGPAALMYGGNAIGGVVNVIDNRIPKEPIEGIGGAVEASATAGGDVARNSSGLIEAGNGQIAIHADAFVRKTSDLHIPGYARSAALRNSQPLPDGESEAYGRLPNTSSAAARRLAGRLLHLGRRLRRRQLQRGTTQRIRHAGRGRRAPPDAPRNVSRWRARLAT
ncbi:TonB-dependent receptor plug domain-containing protein [Cupriavidus basilensis]